MALVGFDLPLDSTAIPRDVRSFLGEAERRVRRFLRTGRFAAFVPSDFARAYRILRALADADLAPSTLFCEWGSGFGVVACLAAMLDEENGAHDELGLDPDDFAVIFAYPWPDEEQVTAGLFQRYAAPGAVLLTHHGGAEFRLRRKTAR